MDATAIVRVNISLIIVGSSCRKMVGYYKLLYFSWWITTYEKYYKKRLQGIITCVWYHQSAADTSLAFRATRSGWWMQKTKIRKEKPKFMYSVALVMTILAAGNENRLLEDLPQADFVSVGCAWKISSVGKNKVNNWEFCTLKTTSIVVLVKIRRIFFRLEP